MKNIRLTVWIGMMCGCLAAGMLQAGTRPDNACPAEEDGSRLWLPVMRPAEGAEVEVIYKGKVSPTITIAIAELKTPGRESLYFWRKRGQGRGMGLPSLLRNIRSVFFHPPRQDCFMVFIVCCVCRRRGRSQYLCRLLNNLCMIFAS